MDLEKTRVYLIGAGDLGREVETWISLDKEFQKKYTVIGYLDRNLKALDEFPSDYQVLGVPEDFNFPTGSVGILCVSNPLLKKQIISNLKNKLDFISYISNNAIISKFSNIGVGSLICPNTIISTNCKIGKFVTLNCSCIVGHDCSIGDYSSLMPHTDLGGHVTLKGFNFLGTKTTIIPGKKLASSINSAAGAVIMRNLSKEGTYIGNPAMKLKY